MNKYFYLKDKKGRYLNIRTDKVHPHQHRGTAFRTLKAADDAWQRNLRDARERLKNARSSYAKTLTSATADHVTDRISSNIRFFDDWTNLTPETTNKWYNIIADAVEEAPDHSYIVNRLKLDITNFENRIAKLEKIKAYEETAHIRLFKGRKRKIKWAINLEPNGSQAEEHGCYKCGVFMAGIEYLQYRDVADSQLCLFCLKELGEVAAKKLEGQDELAEEYHSEIFLKNL